MYSTSRCVNCRRLKQWLAEHKLRYTEFDIERNQRAFREFQQLRARGVPVLVVDGRILMGFDPRQLQKLFKNHL